MKEYRETRQRKLVRDAVLSRCDHPSADQIYEDVYKIDGKISKGTVYRNLKILSEEEEICHVRVPGADRYDSRTDLHYHIICMNCGEVLDIPMEYQEMIDGMVAKKTGYRVNRHRLIAEGICSKCNGECARL